jgi:hypothetical protein
MKGEKMKIIPKSFNKVRFIILVPIEMVSIIIAVRSYFAKDIFNLCAFAFVAIYSSNITTYLIDKIGDK